MITSATNIKLRPDTTSTVVAVETSQPPTATRRPTSTSKSATAQVSTALPAPQATRIIVTPVPVNASTRLVYQKAFGELPFKKNGVPETLALAKVQNFSVSAWFITPQNTPWDYGFQIRALPDHPQYLVLIDNDANGALIIRSSGPTPIDNVIATFKASSFFAGAGDTNLLTIRMIENLIEINVNNVNAGTWSLDEVPAAGEILLITEAYRRSDGINHDVLLFMKLFLWEIP